MNSKYYLNNNSYNWTLSPAYWSANYAASYAWYFYSPGELHSINPSLNFGIRLVINLKSNIQFKSGSGSENNPYVIS